MWYYTRYKVHGRKINYDNTIRNFIEYYNITIRLLENENTFLRKVTLRERNEFDQKAESASEQRQRNYRD